MTLKLDFVTIDAHDPRAIAEFWVSVLDDYAVHDEEEGDDEVAVLPASRRGPKLLFQKVPEGKVVKNRFHFDLRPEDVDAADEVARLEGLGAKKVDIGQSDAVSWTVMADPEGNEFCVLRRLTDEEKVKYAGWAW